MLVLLSSFSDKFFLFTFSCLPPGLHHEFSHHRKCSNGTVMLSCCSCMTQLDEVTLLLQRYAKLKMRLCCRNFFLQCIAMFDKSTGKLAHVSFIYEAQVKLRYYISMHSLQSKLTRWYKIRKFAKLDHRGTLSPDKNWIAASLDRLQYHISLQGLLRNLTRCDSLGKRWSKKPQLW